MGRAVFQKVGTEPIVFSVWVRRERGLKGTEVLCSSFSHTLIVLSLEKGSERTGWEISEFDKLSFSCHRSHGGTGDMAWPAKGRVLAWPGRKPEHEFSACI